MSQTECAQCGQRFVPHAETAVCMCNRTWCSIDCIIADQDGTARMYHEHPASCVHCRIEIARAQEALDHNEYRTLNQYDRLQRARDWCRDNLWIARRRNNYV